MSQHEVYYSNHARAQKFPWSLYHQPLLQDLILFIKSVSVKDMNILIVGPGDFQEFTTIEASGLNISLLDIDPRVIEKTQNTLGDKIKSSYIVDNQFNGYPQKNSFDAIYAKEVIEHIENYDLFLIKLKECLRPNGRIWLSTPNYGHFILPFLESTLLEVVARFSGFSRKNIHPSKFNSLKLKTALEKAGFINIEVKEMPFKFSLTAVAQNK
jgi:2-polyprenyl-3-methyl-5-hydroxy-6-metoxy-1,4-benzoquinol methylase